MIRVFQKFARLVNSLSSLERMSSKIDHLQRELDIVRVMLAKSLADANAGKESKLRDVEFRAFSQYGEDGIIQYLLSMLSLPKHLEVCVEIGCENYREANTRLLLELNQWQTIVFDGSEESVKEIKKLECSWRLNLDSNFAFITRENINDHLRKAGVPRETGLLSLDIDGNDYWTWEALEATSPVIAIIEFNGLFGAEKAIAVPYDPHFNRFKAHHSGLYWGCSLKALELLGKHKGYQLVGTNSSGCNAFFVRCDYSHHFKGVTTSEAYHKPVSRDARDEKGDFIFCNMNRQISLISHLTVFDFETNELTPLHRLISPDC